MKITFIFLCSGMFQDVPACSGMFRNLPCSGFYRRPSKHRWSYLLMPFRDSRNTNTGKQIWMPTKAELFPGESILRSFTNHNTGNYLRHGINITTNQRLSPTFRGNGNTIIVGDSQTSHLPIFPEGGGMSVHRLSNSILYPHPFPA